MVRHPFHGKSVLLGAAVFTLALLSSHFQITMIFDLRISFQSIFLLLALSLFGPGKGTLLALIAGLVQYALWGDAGIAAMVVLETAFVACCLHLRRRNMLLYDAIYWLFIGSLVTVFQYYHTFHTTETELFLLVFKDFVNGITNALLADILFCYFPLHRFLRNPADKQVSFKQLLFHLTVSAVILPFLLFIAAVGYFQYKDMTDNAGRLAANVSSSLKNELESWNSNDLGLLRLNSLIQVSRLDESVQRFSKDSAVEIAILSREGRVFSSSISGSASGEWRWAGGGEVTRLNDRLSLWLPLQGDNPYSLNRWSNGYFVQELELPDYPVNVVVRVPVSHYLRTLEKVYAANFGTLLFFILIYIIVGYITSRWIAASLIRLARITMGLPNQLQAVSRIEWPSSHIEEFTLLIANINGLWARLVSIFQELSRANEKLEIQTRKLMKSEEHLQNLVHTDTLTGLKNRLYYTNSLRDLILQQYGSRQSIAVLFLDLDCFKQINDTLGHAAGDELLRQVASRLTASLTKGTVCRLDGDEFVIIVPETGREEVEIIWSCLFAEFARPFTIMGHTLVLTCSGGISLYPEDAQEADQLTQYADMAMYHAKSTGGNTRAYFSDLAEDHIQQQWLMKHQLHQALAEKQLEVHYQPVVDASTGGIVGAEATIVWNHPEWGTLPADRFISAAEEAGLMAEIGIWFMTETCRQLGQWQQAGHRLTLSLPLSVAQLFDGQLERTLKQELYRHAAERETIELRLGPAVLNATSVQLEPLLAALGELGVTVALHDVGSCSFSLLDMAQLPVRRLYLNAALVIDSLLNPAAACVLSAVRYLAHTLGQDLGVTGVETEQALQTVLACGFVRVQGSVFGSGLNHTGFERLLDTNSFAMPVKHAWRGGQQG